MNRNGIASNELKCARIGDGVTQDGATGGVADSAVVIFIEVSGVVRAPGPNGSTGCADSDS